jgi:hypothetical protein
MKNKLIEVEESAQHAALAYVDGNGQLPNPYVNTMWEFVWQNVYESTIAEYENHLDSMADEAEYYNYD